MLKVRKDEDFMKKLLKQQQKKNIVCCLHVLSIFGYTMALLLFITLPAFLGGGDYGACCEMLQAKIAGICFFIGVICAEISMMFKITEQDLWSIVEEKETLTEEKWETIKELLSSMDDENSK